MKLPLQITFRDLDSSPAIREHVRRRAEKLDTFCDRITSCRVAIEAPNRHTHKNAKQYHVRVDVMVPNKELVAHDNSIEFAAGDLHAVIEAAFDKIEREIEDYNRMSKWDVKRHDGTPRGRVSKLFHDRGFGFLETEDGREIYFHRNSVLRHRWEQLEVGTEVRFAEELGDKGPQASTVEIVGAPRKAPTMATDDVERPSFIG